MISGTRGSSEKRIAFSLPKQSGDFHLVIRIVGVASEERVNSAPTTEAFINPAVIFALKPAFFLNLIGKKLRSNIEQGLGFIRDVHKIAQITEGSTPGRMLDDSHPHLFFIRD
jgi:hypothetical protein